MEHLYHQPSVSICSPPGREKEIKKNSFSTEGLNILTREVNYWYWKQKDEQPAIHDAHVAIAKNIF